MKQSVILLSINELIQKLRSDNSWKLSVAQRAFEWKALRVVNLVDSILRNFPIGSLLVVESRSAYFERQADKKLHKRIKNKRKIKHTQIIDGQQRCQAILSTFGGSGLTNPKSGDKEYLWINVRKVNPSSKEFSDKQGQKYYFHWSTREQINELRGSKRKKEKFPARSPITGWVKFHEFVSFITDNKSISFIKRKAMLNETTETLKSVRKSMKMVLKEKYIPVHYLQEEDRIEDLFHVFIRINTGGMPLSAVDTFFAGVKKYWGDAEEHLKRIVENDSVFERRDAITLLARCASKSLNDTDPVQVSLSNLTHRPTSRDNKPNYPMIKKMQELTPKSVTSDFIAAVEWTSKLMREKFYYASHLLPSKNIMSVIAWAFQYLNRKGEMPNYSDNEFIKPIISFLFWTTILQSGKYGRNKFYKETFRFSWEAGINLDIFPYEKMKELCFDHEFINGENGKIPEKSNISTMLPPDKRRKDEIRNVDKIFDLMHHQPNKGIFLSLYHKITHENIEWDHVIAYNYVYKQFRVIKEGKQFKESMKWTNRIGNFAGIDSSANSTMQDRPPDEKFFKPVPENGESYLNDDFIKTDPRIEKKGYESCYNIQEYFENERRDQRHLAKRKLSEFVANRSLKIWKSALKIAGNPPIINPK
jgi:hypothetical protein